MRLSICVLVLALSCARSEQQPQSSGTSSSTDTTPAPASAELDRAKAKTLIAQAKGFDSVDTIVAKSQAFDLAVNDKLLKPRHYTAFGQKDPTGSGPWELDELGAKIFTIVNMAEFGLRTPLHRAVSEVTGITDGPQPGSTKNAEFRWYFTDLSEPVAKYTGVTNSDHGGQASFRKYDDGWRVEQVQYESAFDGTNTRPLTAGEFKPLALVGAFKGQIVGDPPSDVSPVRPMYAEFWHDPSRPAEVFGFFFFENKPASSSVIEKFDGTMGSGVFTVTDRVEGAKYELHLAGGTLSGKDRGQLINLKAVPPARQPGVYYTKNDWDKAYPSSF